jgi:transcriptional regulator with XRE-family HTH domain
MHVRARPSCDLVDALGELSDKAVSRAIGEELRRTREARGWSRDQLVKRLPSGIGDRTILSYEHGTRQFTVLRLIELGRALGVDGPTLLRRGLQRARIYVETMTLHVDLRELLRDSKSSSTFRPMAQWAQNALNENPGGVMDVEPAVVRNLALFVGCLRGDLAKYLARFTPDDHFAYQPEALPRPE